MFGWGNPKERKGKETKMFDSIIWLEKNLFHWNGPFS